MIRSAEHRLPAVADVYESLTAARPSREELPREKVLAIRKKDAGQHLCPACLAAWEQGLDRTTVTPRVEAQLEELDRLHNQRNGQPVLA
jgi:HD-GYP domain-containing protein (c-di-GMP phosphodiesterase class II)